MSTNLSCSETMHKEASIRNGSRRFGSLFFCAEMLGCRAGIPSTSLFLCSATIAQITLLGNRTDPAPRIDRTITFCPMGVGGKREISRKFYSFAFVAFNGMDPLCSMRGFLNARPPLWRPSFSYSRCKTTLNLCAFTNRSNVRATVYSEQL